MECLAWQDRKKAVRECFTISLQVSIFNSSAIGELTAVFDKFLQNESNFGDDKIVISQLKNAFSGLLWFDKEECQKIASFCEFFNSTNLEENHYHDISPQEKIILYYWKAKVEYESEKYLPAFKTLQKTLDLNPTQENLSLKNQLAELWYQIGKKLGWKKNNIQIKSQEALEAFQQAVELNPNHLYANGNYAIFLKNIKKDYEQTEKYYKKALELDPEDANINGNYAIFLDDIKKDYDQAEEYYKKALELDPESANKNGNYAGFLYAQKRNTEAEQYWQKAFDILDQDNQTETSLLLELYFYHFANSQQPEKVKKAKQEIQKLLNQGITSPGWDLSYNIQTAKQQNHPEINLVQEFADKISKINYEL